VATDGQPRDRVDVIMDDIAPLMPGADLTAKALCHRLRRVAHQVEIHLRRELATFDIEPWELELLACLRRAGPPYQTTPSSLQDSMQLTTGAITKRVTTLERRGWVFRTIDPSDRRQVLVCLTDDGEKRAMDVFGTKTETEARVLAGLEHGTQQRLNDDLRLLLVQLEGPVPE
jgi:DNA-binding MarR family transcriptional regulator